MSAGVERLGLAERREHHDGNLFRLQEVTA